VKVALGRFARSGIETRLGGDVSTGVQLALHHYARRLRSARRPIDAPHFASDTVPSEGATMIDVTLDPEVQAVLEQEARRQQLPLEQILHHAVLVCLADFDFGREAGGGAVSADPSGPVGKSDGSHFTSCKS
jgi:hypothetical protein